MTANASDKYQLILEKVPEEKQQEAELFLSGCFSLPRNYTARVAASSPIALIADLRKDQAEAILGELRATLPEGVMLVVIAENDRPRVSRMQWQRLPKVYGRAIEEFAAAGEETRDVKCPICGGNLRIVQDDSGLAVAIPGDRRRSETAARPAPTPETDDDPLFSGVKPLATGTGNYASIRSLQAGDTGFWMDHAHSAFAPPPEEPPPSGTRHGRSESSGGARKSGSKSAAGLAAFMKPGAFAVIVARTKDAPTVKMIAEIMGMGESDARDKCLDLGLCVARDISLDEAQNLLTRFRNLGAKARIVKPS